MRRKKSARATGVRLVARLIACDEPVARLLSGHWQHTIEVWRGVWDDFRNYLISAELAQ